MEIMKIYSDSYDEERIYSVLMSEEELYLFSEIQREFGIQQGIKNSIRKLGRNARHLKTEIKVAAGKDLTNKEAGMMAAKAKNRLQRLDNGKMSNITKKAIDFQGGREALKDSADFLTRKYKSGQGIKNLGFGSIM